jgi:imidazolonepropionase-like amidohydrolase
VLHFGEFEAEYVIVNASDRAGERFATIRFYDPEDVDEAMAELDRLQGEIEAGTASLHASYCRLMRSTSSPSMVLEADRLFDGHSSVTPGRVAVSDGVISAVGDLVEGEPDERLVGHTLLPGLVDCHQHLVFDGDGTFEEQVGRCDDDELRERARTNARLALEGGVTTLRDLGDRGYVTLDLRDDPELPTILASGPPLTIVQGHCWYLGGECADGDALVAGVRERHERGCDVVKIMATGGAGTPTVPGWVSQFAPDDLRRAVAEAHGLGLPVAAHCHGEDGIAQAVDAGVDTIEHCTFINPELNPDPDPALLERLAASGIELSATIGECPAAPPPPPVIAEVRPKIRRVHARLREMGVQIVVGTDAGISPAKPHDVARYAISALTDMGMSPVEALHAMTAAGADAIDRPDKGRIAVGAAADLIAVPGDPTEDPTAMATISRVWRAGRPIL